jgi:AcrR family transcriptional regulator
MVQLRAVRSDAARNRARILAVARELVARDGPAVSMDDIAREAGVAVGTLYRHHPTKAALVAAVVADSVEAIAVAAEEAVARVEAGASAGGELADLFRLAAERHTSDRAAKEAVANLGGSAPWDGTGGFDAGTAEQRAWDAIMTLFAAAVAEGEVRADLTPPDLLVLLNGVPDDSVDPAVRDRYIEIVLAGLRPLAD